MKNKLFMIIIALTIFLISCDKTDDVQNKRNDIIFEDNVIQVKEEATDIAFSEVCAFVTYNNGIAKYDLTSGEKTDLLKTDNLTSIYIYNDYIYAYNNTSNSIIQIDESGKVMDTYELSNEISDVDEICINGDNAIIVSRLINKDGNPESELYLLNLKKKECKKITDNYRGSDYFYVQEVCFENENTILVTYTPTTSLSLFLNLNYKIFRYDIKNEKLIDEFLIQGTEIYYNDLDNKLFYYQDYKIYEYNFNDELKSVYSFDKEYLNSFSNIKNYSLTPNKFVISDNNVIIWNQANKLIFTISTPNSETLPLVILAPSFHSLGHYEFENFLKTFENEYDSKVHIITYNNDVFNDKLRTKLLANESDFDIILLRNPSTDSLLSNLLKLEVFEPLNSYNGIINNFSNMYSGIQSMMTYNDKIFGLPYDIIIPTFGITENFQKHDISMPKINWSFDDIWRLCEDIIALNEPDLTLFNSNYAYNFITYFIQNAVNNNNIDKEELHLFLSNISKYSDKLYDLQSEKDYLITYAQNYFGYLMSDFTESSNQDRPFFPEFGIISEPAYGGASYVSLDGCIMINKFSKNKDMAANFITSLFSIENIYNNNLFQNILLGADLKENLNYDKWDETQLSYLEKTQDMYNNSLVHTIDFYYFWDVIREEYGENYLDEFLEGKINVDEITNTLYNKINYIYFE